MTFVLSPILAITLWFQKRDTTGKKMTWLENGLKICLFLKFFNAASKISIPFILRPNHVALSPFIRPFSSRVIFFPVVSLFWNQRVSNVVCFFLRPFVYAGGIVSQILQ